MNESIFQDGSDALSLEYKRDYGTACRQLEISDFVNNPFINSPSYILGLLLPEQVGGFPFIEVGVVDDNAPDAILVSENTF